MTAYYSENEPFAAAWLRNLIQAGHIAPGDVDERDIRDVKPDDLRGYSQCHFFAGIGGWSRALRLAGWPDDRPVFTGSCPCQPFSAAGKGGGFTDERHLWPDWFWLISQCRPSVVFGEQVDKAVKWGWLDLVFSDLESAGYACGAAVLPAASVGAPHIRQRAWFVADNAGARLERPSRAGLQTRSAGLASIGDAGKLGNAESRAFRSSDDLCEGESDARYAGLVGDPHEQRSQGRTDRSMDTQGRQASERPSGFPDGRMADDGMEHSEGNGWVERRAESGGRSIVSGCSTDGSMVHAEGEQVGLPGRPREPRSSPWSDAIWLPCTDGKARPTQPEIQPLAHGIPNRVGLLRGAGNAIVPQVAEAFIRAYLEAV